MKSNFEGLPARFEQFGPRIRIPRAETVCIAGWNRLDPPHLCKQIITFSFEQVCFYNLITGLVLSKYHEGV